MIGMKELGSRKDVDAVVLMAVAAGKRRAHEVLGFVFALLAPGQPLPPPPRGKLDRSIEASLNRLRVAKQVAYGPDGWVMYADYVAPVRKKWKRRW